MRVSRIELDGIGPFEGAIFDFPEPPTGKLGELFFFEGPNGSGKTTLAMTIAMNLGPWLDGERVGWGDTMPWFADPPFLWGKRLFRDDSQSRMIVAEENERVVLSHNRKSTSLEVLQSHLGLGLDQLGHYHRARRGEKVELRWSAFAFTGHQQTPVVKVSGPSPFTKPPIQNALLFGHAPPPPLGQLLINLDYQRARALAYVIDPKQTADRERSAAVAQLASASLARIQRALSLMLDREVSVQFDLSEPGPCLSFDGQEIPLELLGEGLRSTTAWLADLIVQLETTTWARKDISPFEQHFWLILDEVEESLHPQMQMRLFPALRDLFPNACIYATTHSPFVVASMGEGYVFSLQPDPKTHRVSGIQKARPLVPGQTLERVVMEVFETPFTFIDPQTR